MSASATATTERKSFLPLRLRSTTVVGSSNIPTASRPITPVGLSMPPGEHYDTKSTFAVGERVLVNGLKIGTLRYAGTVKFAPGWFYGVELDEPEGKHDGQVNDFRYFQCKANHGVFVPADKVVLAPRPRASSTYRTISRLKPPTVTRTMTLASSVRNRTESVSGIPIPTHAQLPDIIPSPTPASQPIAINSRTGDSITIDDHETMTPTEEPRLISRPILRAQPIAIDEPSETVEADFTDSVSLILHQLQQEQKINLLQPRGSLTISEGSANDDDEVEDDTDDCDSASVAGSGFSERIRISRRSSSTQELTKAVQTDLSFDVNDNTFIVKNNLCDSISLSSSNRSLAGSTASINKLKLNPTDKKVINRNKRPSIPTAFPVVKKDPERKLSMTLVNNATLTRRISLLPTKKGSPTITRQNSTNSVVSSGPQSKLNHSHSSITSIDDSHTSTVSTSRNSFKPTPKPARSADHESDKNANSPRATLDALDQQVTMQKTVIQSLEETKDHLKKQYQYLLNQFDTLCIFSQYSLTENDQMKQQYERQLVKAHAANKQLKTLIERLQASHKVELITLEEQHQNQLTLTKDHHQQQIIAFQQEIDKVTNEKKELDARCTSLQGEVDRFMDEMANSEHADPLLRRVEILEKDRASLQTVVEFRNQELTQLRTKINEQVFQREDQLALQKRIDMAENRNQDLVCLLRNWQLNEKSVGVECDELKEQLAQLERDNRQLTFENETLLYRLRELPSSTPVPRHSNLNVPAPSGHKLRNRVHSSSSIMTSSQEADRLPRSSSLTQL